MLLTVSLALTLALASVAAAPTVAPTSAERTRVLTAFGDPPVAWSCLSVRIAAADHRFATVRLRRVARCEHWAFDGVNVAERHAGGDWVMAFEGSSYHCPIARIPRPVQRELGVCPRA